MVKNIVTMEEVTEAANLLDNPENIMSEISDGEIYRLVNRFYRQRTDITPISYTLKFGDKTVTLESTLWGGKDRSVDNIRPMQLNHSHFSSDGLDIARIDQENSWNGDKAGLIYKDGTLKVLKSDYYTTRSFGSIPYVEAANVIAGTEGSVDKIELNSLTCRDEYLSTKKDLQQTRWLASGGSVGGVILANSGDGWHIILGRRSDKTRINPNRISMVPNGALRYNNITDNGLMKDLKLHFNEEIFRGKRQPNFFEDFVKPQHVSTGWNLTSGEMAMGYTLMIDDPKGYNMLKEVNSHNFEFSELVDVDVNNIEEISNILSFKNISPTVIPTVCRSLAMLERKMDDVDLDYSISRKE